MKVIIFQNSFRYTKENINLQTMSDQQDQSNANSEEQQQDEQNSQQQQDQDDEDQDQDQDDDDQDQDEDQDDEEQQSGDNQNEDQEQADQQEESQKQVKLPTFNMVQRQPPQQFKFTSLLSQISNLSSSVDSFIGTLHSSGSSSIKRPYTSTYAAQQTNYTPKIQEMRQPLNSGQSRVVMMKDQDTQVDMKPQIIIQPTKTIKEDPIIQAKPYKIANQSEKFLAQLYEQNKKLKRWQNNPNHAMNSYMSSQAGTNGFGQTSNFGNSSKGFYGNKDNKFQRKQYEKGLFNVDQRNKQIDEAILMLRREQQQNY